MPAGGILVDVQPYPGQPYSSFTISVDGDESGLAFAGEHRVPLPAGPHHVRVSTRHRGQDWMSAETILITSEHRFSVLEYRTALWIYGRGRLESEAD
jgi:hypothetical protein